MCFKKKKPKDVATPSNPGVGSSDTIIRPRRDGTTPQDDGYLTSVRGAGVYANRPSPFAISLFRKAF